MTSLEHTSKVQASRKDHEVLPTKTIRENIFK